MKGHLSTGAVVNSRETLRAGSVLLTQIHLQAVMAGGSIGDPMVRTDPPKIRVVVRTRPMSAKVALPSCALNLHAAQTRNTRLKVVPQYLRA